MSDDNIGHPPHYIAPNGMECIDVIEAFGLGFALGILRAGKKGERTEDLRKARWYLEREISGRAPSESHTDLMLRGWQDCARGAEAERDKLQAEVLHLRALIAEHTEDETCWRETAEVSSKHLQEWREWAVGMRNLHTSGMRAGEASDAHMMDLVGGLALRPKADTTDWRVCAESWRRTAEHKEAMLTAQWNQAQPWRDWADALIEEHCPGRAGALDAQSIREIIARLTHRQPPKRKRKAKK